MKTFTLTHMLLVSVAALGCAATGVKVTEEQLAGLQVGLATEVDVLQRLGQPTMRMRQTDGTVTLQYTYAEARARAASFVPVVGLFVGGSDIRANSAVLTFGADGKLKTTSVSSSQYGSGTGISAGQVAPAVGQQPRQ